MEEGVPCVIAAWTILQGHLSTSTAEALKAAHIPCSWVLWLNTANLPQRTLVTQLSLPPEICRHSTRGSKIQADIYIYSTVFISTQPFLHARRFTEHWRLCSQSAGLWVRALLQQNWSDKLQIPVCAAWNWNIWSRNIFLTTSFYITPGHLQ